MKRILIAAFTGLFSLVALAVTTTPPSLISPTGSSAGQAIISTGPSSPPAWQSVPLTGVTGVLPIANGGTNASTTATALSNLGGAALTGATFTGAITPSQTAGIVGTTTNNDANAGAVGQFVSNTTNNIPLTAGVDTNITSISLSSGDWDVTGSVAVVGEPTTVLSNIFGGVSSTSATFGPLGSYWNHLATLSSGATVNQAIPVTRFSLSATTTVYIVVRATFTTSTASASAFIRARRVR